MMLDALLTAALLTQTPDASMTAAERSAQAAQRAAEAAEKAAAAAERIADAMAPKVPAAPAEAPVVAPSKWGGNVALGVTLLTGNSQAMTLTGSLAADRKWNGWAFGLRLSGAWGLSNPSSTVEGSTAATTARRAAGTVRGDRSFGAGFASVFLLAGSELDHVKNVESRTVGEVGAGLTFFNQKVADLEKLYLRFDIAARSGYETRFQYFPVATAINPYALVILAPRVALTFRWAFSEHVRVSEEIEFIPFLLAPELGRLLITNTTKLNARLTESLSLVIGLLVNYDSSPPQAPAPAAQRVPTDVALTVGLEAAF